VNGPVAMALLPAASALLAMISLAPWVIQMLYASSFSPAVEILRWQALGDIFKVASVPVVFIFLATGHGGLAIGIQILWSSLYLGALFVGFEKFGLVMAGVAFWIAYLIYYVAAVVAANRLIGYRPTRRSLLLTAILLVAGGVTIALSTSHATAGYVFGIAATFLVGGYSLRRLNQLVDVIGWLRLKFR
ncbi:MAG: hypothetical protein AB8G17_17460, partial [Gammaproteobacteria bacterium]